MKRYYLFLIIILFPLLTGTTYVVKEGGKEVGRYDVSDGKSDVVDADNEKPRPSSKRQARSAKASGQHDVFKKRSLQAASQENLKRQLAELSKEGEEMTKRMQQEKEKLK